MSAGSGIGLGASAWDAAVVMDLGSGAIKAGLAGEDAPRVSVANLVGGVKYARVMTSGALGTREQ